MENIAVKQFELGGSEREHIHRFIKFMETDRFQNRYQNFRNQLELDKPNEIIEEFVTWLKAGEPEDWNGPRQEE